MSNDTVIIEKAVTQADKNRRIAFADQEIKMLKWALAAIFFSLSVIATGAISLYRLNVVADEEKTTLHVGEHGKVHEIQDQDREHIKESLEKIEIQLISDAVKIDNTDKNIYKIMLKLEIDQ